ncbi:hypothetical protein CVT25_001998 [Psilocybe cyanescens]|uniref:Uncharacterized protein n=1 Tax=Psilocybe cyanescens TaxID=93625 RepID=A0A409X9G4_PSICY|nr:hypothetical protein CVT25_001998 [Psilocybe cyanescens]
MKWVDVEGDERDGNSGDGIDGGVIDTVDDVNGRMNCGNACPGVTADAASFGRTAGRDEHEKRKKEIGNLHPNVNICASMSLDTGEKKGETQQNSSYCPE